MKPTIMLAFANDKNNPLEMLIQEGKSIWDILGYQHHKGFIEVYKEDHTSLEDIFKSFTRFTDRIVIFHYGGHASGTHLRLRGLNDEKQMANAQGLAQLMGQEKELKLVFLNGCATQGQVADLLSAGVKAVIATSVSIGDEKAVKFARQFYSGLAGGDTIHKAFIKAAAFIHSDSQYGSASNINEYMCSISSCLEQVPNLETPLRLCYYEDESKQKRVKIEPRDITGKGVETGAEIGAGVDIPWGLHYNESFPEVLEWKLPDSIPDLKKVQVNTSHLRLKSKLLDVLYQEFVHLKFIDERQFDGDSPDSTSKQIMEVMRAVLERFPLPVGVQLRRLFANKAFDKERFKQSISTYQAIAKMLCFTLLAHMWNEKYNNPGIFISDDYMKHFDNFFAMTEDNYNRFNYARLIEAIAGVFKENEIEYFVEILKIIGESFLDKNELYEAFQHMEEAKEKFIGNRIDENQIELLCRKLDEHLGCILKNLISLFNRTFVSIRTIKAKKGRHETNPRYVHEAIILTESQMDFEKRKLPHNSCTNNDSVIFLKNIGNFDKYLNLSPFVIDQNALKDKEGMGGKITRIFFYGYQEESKDRYCFKSIEDEDLIVSDQEFGEIKYQLQQFKNCVHNEL